MALFHVLEGAAVGVVVGVVGRPNGGNEDGMFIEGSGNGRPLGNVVGKPLGNVDGSGNVGGLLLVADGCVVPPVAGGCAVAGGVVPFDVKSGATFPFVAGAVGVVAVGCSVVGVTVGAVLAVKSGSGGVASVCACTITSVTTTPTPRRIGITRSHRPLPRFFRCGA